MEEPAANLYFDNAATSWPKPEAVYGAAGAFLRNSYGNPGRSGGSRSLASERLVYRIRERLARFFGSADPSRVVFTLNATDALNIALKGILEPGDHVIFTAMEHNSVLRPLGSLRRAGRITATMVPCDREGYPDLDCMEKAFKARTRLVVATHASNVTGTILPAEEMIRMAHARGATFLLDAAQSAGVLPVDAVAMEADLVAFAGHKGLLAPPGTGGLYVRPGLHLKPFREGGTGSFSEQDLHPETMPERLEAGTLNTPGLAGLEAGLSFIEETGLPRIREHEQNLRSLLLEGLSGIPGATIYGPRENERCVGVLSFTLDGTDCGELGHVLESAYGIITRTGLHCAPLAHGAIGTFPHGTVRLSPGFFNTESDARFLVEAVSEIARLRRPS